MFLLTCPACAATNRVPQDRLSDEPVCGRCGAPLSAGEPVLLDDTSLPRMLSSRAQPVLVDFFATWCGPCRQMAPQFQAAAQRMPGVRFAKVDIDASPRAAQAYGIRSVPTLALFDQGREVARVSGAMTAPALLEWVQTTLSVPGTHAA